MTTRSSVKSTLVQEFISNFDSTIPVNLDNIDNFFFCTSPNLTVTTKPSDSIWVRFYITNNTSKQASFGSIGNRDFRRYGLINYQVFIPQGKGTKNAEEICEEINDIFEGKRFDIVHCEEGTYKEANVQEDGFFMFVGNIPFNFDIHK